ncbi:diguanylate cyclase [Thalassolituus sp. UBA3500]|uniref:diguanylate cyclase n=1 Tax=Thalassolituus sp. UBA3500 TaxID=1947664 RepID=UPI00263BC192|nr:diguanylate cyclase [Thalassolituus sp. UBA3500]
MFLVIEDSSIVQKILKHTFKQQRVEPVLFASTMSEGKKLYEDHKSSLVAALVDISLPDAPRGEMAEYLLDNEVPIVVLTGSDDLEQRQSLLKSGVADYVIKENRFSYQYAVRMLDRLDRNRRLKALVVDDSSTMRQVVAGYLKLQCFSVVEAADGQEGLEILELDSDISLVITDFHMPVMDGFHFVQEIRHRFDKRPLAVIGLSSQEDSDISVQFIKKGANDFLQKPFQQEEFSCRVTNNIEALEQLIALRKQADKDYLTGLNNRRYFVEEGQNLVRKMVSEGTAFSIALMDIDHFKSINDEHGHDAGDAVLTQLADHLENTFSRFHLARYGGEEFALVLPGLDVEKAYGLLDQFRRYVGEQLFILPDDDYLRVSVSTGLASVTSPVGETLEGLLLKADEALYLAKEGGRNLVTLYEPPT